jgi:serine/threonine protein kinase
MAAEHTTGIGTFIYASPEQINAASTTPSAYTWSADIYSLGILLVELFVPFPTGMERALVLGRLREHEPRLPPDFVSWWPKQAALALWCIQPTPTLRPAATDILAYLQTMDHIGADSSVTLGPAGVGGDRASQTLEEVFTPSPVDASPTPPPAPQGPADPGEYIRFLEDRLHLAQQECELLRKENVQLKVALSTFGVEVDGGPVVEHADSRSPTPLS